MKSTVTRYTFNPCRDDSGLYERADGEYVDYCDYAVLSEIHAGALALLAGALKYIEAEIDNSLHAKVSAAETHYLSGDEVVRVLFNLDDARALLGLPLVAPAPPPS